jgi:hypothetical protein
MFGGILKSATRMVSSPLDIADIGMDVLTGGDGSKRSRRDSPLSGILETRDEVANAFEELDED